MFSHESLSLSRSVSAYFQTHNAPAAARANQNYWLFEMHKYLNGIRWCRRLFFPIILVCQLKKCVNVVEPRKSFNTENVSNRNKKMFQIDSRTFDSNCANSFKSARLHSSTASHFPFNWPVFDTIPADITIFSIENLPSGKLHVFTPNDDHRGDHVRDSKFINLISRQNSI